MKKIVLMAAMAALTIPNGFGKPWQANISIDFGHGKPSCLKKGICRVTIGGGPTELAILDEASGSFLIQVSEAYILKNQPDKIADFKGKSTYTIPETWVAPSELLIALHASNGIVINAGEYPLVYKNGIYIIEMKIK